MAKKATTARKASSKSSAKSARGFAPDAKITVVKGVENPYREGSRFRKAADLAEKVGTVEKYQAGFSKLKGMGTCKPAEVLAGASKRGYFKIA